MGKNRNHYKRFFCILSLSYLCFWVVEPVFRVQMPDAMYGRWKSSAGRPEYSTLQGQTA